ncbi:MAG: alkaline phosphatase family protein [Candidatus Aminicenantes bacterium]|nr:alkaline phosphatase family protein [Candidatus Aminicenantes bacterium]
MSTDDRKSLSLAPAIRSAYGAGQEDEALEPIITCDAEGRPVGRIRPGDGVIFYDIRGEREVELTEALTDPGFSHFAVEPGGLKLDFATMIEYAPRLDVKVAFAPEDRIGNTLTEVVTRAGLRLVKVSESEKAIHVGHFLNGKSDEAFSGEERVVVPSPAGVANYAETPEMNARGVVEAVRAKAADGRCDVIIANLANVDVLGHIEDKPAVLKAVEAVDAALGDIEETARAAGLTLIVTADHGTVEEWLYPDGAVNTGHTKNPVPFILCDFGERAPERARIADRGELADIAPTVLGLLGLPVPAEMTGRSLVLSGAPAVGDKTRKRVLLLILDGWGVREKAEGNLIAEARTPNFDGLWVRYPRARLDSFGEAVGMPVGTVGNSEAGHLHIGAGRRVLLDRVKIDRAIEDGSFDRNEAFRGVMERTRARGAALHLLGIVSFFSSHGTLRHLFALLRMAAGLKMERVYIHALIGRRGEKPESGAIYTERVEEECRRLGVGQVVTVIGRFWALDREENWDRIEKTWRALVRGEGTPVRP